MDSNANDLNCRDRIRWGDNYKVYTRKHRRKTLENTNAAVSPPEPPCLQTLEADDVAVIQFRDSSIRKGRTFSEVVVDVSDDECTRGSELRDPTEGSCGRNVEKHGDETQSCNLEVKNNNNAYVVKPVVISRIQDSDEHTRGSAGDGELRDPTEGSSGRDVENHRHETQSCNLEVENNNGYVVKPVISRIQDRVRINLKDVRFKDEIRELSTSLESELDQVRSLVKEVEAKQFQLTAYRSTSINGGSVTTAPGGSISSYSHSQYNMDDGVIKHRSLVRVNSDVHSVGHIRSRPFQRPSFLFVENSNGSSDFMEKEKRTPKANQYYRNSEFLLGKDRLPPESNKRMRPNGSGKKHSGDSESGFGLGFDKHRLQVFRSCGSLLERLMKHQHGWVFNVPVNAKALGLHDYHVIITHPMDLGTIKTRLSQNWYKSPREFAEDVRLVFYNAMTYNPKGQDVHVMAEHLSEIFEDRWAVIEAEYNSDWRHQTYHDAGTPTPTSRRTSFAPSFLHTPVASHSLAPIARQLQTLDRSESMIRPVNPKMKRSNTVHVARTPIPKKPKAKDPNKRDMTYEEKQKLSTNLQGLPTEKLDAIVQIIKKRNSTLNQDNDEIEVDIDSVDAETLWELDRFVTNFRKSFSKYKRKAELALRAREVAAQTARIVSLTAEVADAPRENGTGEKDTTPATLAEGGRPLHSASRSSSSSSSSSDSGSSSSDSDSDSSSASGSEAAHSPRT